MSQFHTIFWDNDGVLVDTERLYFQACREILATVGVDLTTELYREFTLRQGKGAWHLADPDRLPPENIPVLRDRRNARYSELLQQQSLLIDGVKETLAALHGRYGMGIVTSSSKEHFDIIHRSTEILRYFDFILTGDEFTKLKPEPEPYLRALEESGRSPEQCVVIEDSERGLIAAQRAGIPCIVIPTALNREGNFDGAYKILHSITEVPATLETSMNSRESSV